VGENNIAGIPVAKRLRITHLMFLDDVVLFGICCKTEWGNYKKVLELFCKATGMDFSSEKYVFLEARWET